MEKTNKLELNFISLEEFSNLFGFKKTPVNNKFIDTINKLDTKSKLIKYYQKKELLFNLEEVNKYFSEHMSYNTILRTYGLSSQTLKKIIKSNNLESDFFGNTYDHIFLAKKLVKKYISDDDFISGYELLATLGIDKRSKKELPRRALTSVLKNLEKDKSLCSLIGYRRLDFPLYFKDLLYPHHIVFRKDLVASFFQSHISTKLVIDELNIQKNTLVNSLTKNNFSIYTFYTNYEYKFITQKAYEFIKDLKKLRDNGASTTFLINERYKTLKASNKYCTKVEFSEHLKLTLESLNLVLSTYNILPYEVVNCTSNNVNFYSKEDLNVLIVEQRKLEKYYTENYYNYKQIKNINSNYNYGLFYQAANSGRVSTEHCPPILRGIFASSSKLYKKSDINKLLKDHQENQQMTTVKMDSPYSEFTYKTEIIMKVSFSNNLLNTKELWYQFVKLQLQNKTLINSSSYINQLARTSLVLSSTLSKEIFNYTNNSLNLSFFNENIKIPISIKRIIYDFYKSIAQSVEEKVSSSNFQLKQINNPHKFSRHTEIDMTRYSYNEYKQIYEYSIDISTHKLKAIEDLESLIKNEKYNHYDSYWLYILTHLTNNWRHSTIISAIPQIELSETEIINLEWLKHNNLNINDANKIIFQIGRTVKEISKTGAEAEFNIPEPLKIAFATAACICQLRVNYLPKENNLKNSDTGQLLWLNKKYVITPKRTVHKSFFRDFIPLFKFSNRKMNRTLTTLIWSVFKSLKVSQVSRSHLSEDSTMHYIKLSDKQLDELVTQIFERNSFGYISQLLTERLFEEDDDKKTQTKKILAIQEKFGDVQKIEVSIGLLNLIAKQNDDVLKFVNGLTQEEINNLISKSMTNTLYTKQRYYQCVFSKCKYDEYQECSNCPYSIINVYALSNLMNLYLEKIQNLITKFDHVSPGEKQKLANHFFLLWKQIQSAKLQFGDIIYDFVEGGKDRLNTLSKEMPKTKMYLSDNFINFS